MNGIESPILSYSDPIQFSQVPPLERRDTINNNLLPQEVLGILGTYFLENYYRFLTS